MTTKPRGNLAMQLPRWVLEERITLAYLLGAFVTLALLVLISLDVSAQEDQEAQQALGASQAMFLVLEAQRRQRDQPQAQPEGQEKPE